VNRFVTSALPKIVMPRATPPVAGLALFFLKRRINKISERMSSIILRSLTIKINPLSDF
jgi:hypothetical protein